MSTSIQKQVLINARALIADPARWTMWMLASTANGRPVAWHDASARRWCAVGAIHRAAFDLVGNKRRAVCIATEVINNVYPPTWVRRSLPALNDARGHAAVIELFDRALMSDQEVAACGAESTAPRRRDVSRSATAHGPLGNAVARAPG
jgi:hypothetical protein